MIDDKSLKDLIANIRYEPRLAHRWSGDIVNALIEFQQLRTKRTEEESIQLTIGLQHGQNIIMRERGSSIWRTGFWDSVVGFVGDDGYLTMKGCAEWHTLPFDKLLP